MIVLSFSGKERNQQQICGKQMLPMPIVGSSVAPKYKG
jgi:hypothetical protein